MAAGRIGRQIGHRTLMVIAVASLAVGSLLAAPAGAATQLDPPGWTGTAPPTAYIGFTVDDPSPNPIGRTEYEPVTVTRTTNLSGQDLIDAFDNWEELDLEPPTGDVDHWRWPPVWDEPGGVQMTRLDDCDISDDTCRYAVTADGDFFYFAGAIPVDGNGDPLFDLSAYDQTLDLVDLPQITIGTLNAVGTPGVNGAGGTIHLTVAGTNDPADLDPPLTYKWVLVGPRSKIYTSEGTDDFFNVTAEMDGVYCIELTVTASDGIFVETPKCNAGGSTFSITGVAPAKTETPGPTPGGGGGIPGIGFSNPTGRAPATLTGGTPGESATVIWLWRPEWFQGSPATREVPRTDGQPKVTGRADIVVRSPSPKGASAGPWLAGVGIFGLMGGGWVVSRRRRLRMLAEL